VGVDQTNEYNQILTKFMTPDVAPYFAGSEKGGITVVQRNLTYTSLDYSLSAQAHLSKDLVATTSAGGQFYRRQVTTINASGLDFPGPGPFTVNATARNRTTAQDFLKNSTIGVYAQEQLAWRNRLFLTGALRVDNNSAFGSEFNLVSYPKVSGSWVISEEPFWHVGFINTLKLRAAYGQSGEQPAALTALRTYSATTGPADVAAVIPTNIGAIPPRRTRQSRRHPAGECRDHSRRR
jgi:outer membrane receptor protein involved in Fe transport